MWVNYELENDYLPSGFSQRIDTLTQVAFAGYGITSMENNWDDYKKINVKRKAVIVLRGVPPLKDAKWGDLSRIRNKAQNAKKHGAAAFLTIGSPIGIAANKQIIPGIIITEKVANDVLKGSGFTIKTRKEKIDNSDRHHPQMSSFARQRSQWCLIQ